jgi:hypothetical protein
MVTSLPVKRASSPSTEWHTFERALDDFIQEQLVAP